MFIPFRLHFSQFVYKTWLFYIREPFVGFSPFLHRLFVAVHSIEPTGLASYIRYITEFNVYFEKLFRIFIHTFDIDRRGANKKKRKDKSETVESWHIPQDSKSNRITNKQSENSFLLKRFHFSLPRLPAPDSRQSTARSIDWVNLQLCIIFLCFTNNTLNECFRPEFFLIVRQFPDMQNFDAVRKIAAKKLIVSYM